jgi:hypothetical protein
MRTIRESIKLAVPVELACDYWLQYDEFPRLLAPLTRADAALEGDPVDWDSETIERRPDRLVLSRNDDRTAPSTAEFASLSADESRITVSIVLDRARPDLYRHTRSHLHQELARFKRAVEERANRPQREVAPHTGRRKQ